MKKLFLFLACAVFLISCTRTENGLILGAPDYEKRSIKATERDLKILQRADELLASRDIWVKNSIRQCNEEKKLNLYCALEKSSIDVMGEFIHRQTALQEVRFVIDDNYSERWKVHRLADFNAHPDTTFQDVKLVLGKAIKVVQLKLKTVPAH